MFDSNPLKGMKEEKLGLSKQERAQNQEEEPYHGIDQARAEVIEIHVRTFDEPTYNRECPDLSEEDAA
jgi:hypothetical protein